LTNNGDEFLLAPAKEKLSNANFAQGASSRQARRIRATIDQDEQLERENSQSRFHYYSIFNGGNFYCRLKRLDSFD